MNGDEKIKKMDRWIKPIFIMVNVMAVIAISAFVWGETNEDGRLVGFAGDVAVVSIVILGLLILGFMLIFFMGLYIRIIQHAGGNDR